jgi:glycosyltransferase involved in cell wall biosynthesis
MNLNTYNLQEVGLAKALVRRGHTCDVMYYAGKEEDHFETIKFDNGKREIRILWIRGYSFLREGYYPTLKKYVGDYDILQVGGYVGLTSCWLNRKYQDKTVNFQGPYYSVYNKKDNIRAAVFDNTLLKLQHPEKMIAGTKSRLATDYIRSKGITDVTTLGVGLDLDNLCADTEVGTNDFIEMLKKKKDGRYLLYMGRIEERRNVIFLLHVFAEVCKSDPKVKMVIVGKGDASYVGKCRQEAVKLGILDRIIYRDSLEQKYVKHLYKVCDLFLLPTRYEIFGMVLLEAMYFGLPVVTTFNGGSSTVMDEPESGIVIDRLDEKLWTQGIRKVLDDEELRQRIIANAHRKIAEEYTWDALAEKFLAVYRKRLEKK